jgi:hypothetical protein
VFKIFFVEFNDDSKTALKSKIFGKLKEFSWILLNNSEVSSYLLGHITFLKGYDVGFPKKSKLLINFCFEILVCQKNGVSVYLVPCSRKMPISPLREDFRFKSSFGIVIKFYKKLLNT